MNQATTTLKRAGFAYCFVILRNTAGFLFKANDYYPPAHERCTHWNDPAVGTHWPDGLTPQLSAKDQAGITLSMVGVFA